MSGFFNRLALKAGLCLVTAYFAMMAVFYFTCLALMVAVYGLPILAFVVAMRILSFLVDSYANAPYHGQAHQTSSFMYN